MLRDDVLINILHVSDGPKLSKMTTKIGNDVHISLEETPIVEKKESEEGECKQKLIESSENGQEENVSLNRSMKYATVDNLSRKLQIEKKTEFSEFFQIDSGKYYDISSKDHTKDFYKVIFIVHSLLYQVT